MLKKLVYSFIVLILFAGFTDVHAITWSGGGGNALASNPANWVGNAIPVSGDDVLLDNSAQKDMIWDLDITVQNWTQDGYTGRVIIETVYPEYGSFTNLAISGNCIIRSGNLSHKTNANNQAFRLAMTVGGDLTVGPEAAISAEGTGYAASGGPGGKNATGNTGGSHGGRGGSTYNHNILGKGTYGSVTRPIDIGSSGSSGRGGGAILITVNGHSQIDGDLTAVGQFTTYYKGAGGSVWLITSSLSGTGYIRANGGGDLAGSNGLASGGRVAVWLTGIDEDFSNFTGVISTYGSRFEKETSGSPGTVYLQIASDEPDQGELIVDNRNAVPNQLNLYETCASLGDLETVIYDFKKITLRNNGILNIATNNILIATNQIVIDGDPTRCGFVLEGGELRVPANFKIKDFFVGISNIEKPASFDPDGSLTVGSEGTLYIDRQHTFNNDLIIESNGLLTHTSNLWGGVRYFFKEEPEESFNKLNLTVNGDLIIQEGGAIDVSGKGFPGYEGPGRLPDFNAVGASHGGRGGGASVTPAECYGSITDPFTLGSGGVGNDMAGGGVIKLEVTGKLQNNGAIKANAGDRGSYTGAGGTVNITVGKLEGDGPISAVGGSCTGNYPGGGGRIAIALTDPGISFDDYTGKISAFSGRKTSTGKAQLAAPGTVYLRLPDQAQNEGVLFIYNDNLPDTTFTEICANVTDTEVGDVIVSGGATLMLSTNQSLTIKRNFTNSGTVDPRKKSVFIFTDANSLSQIKGSSTLPGITVNTPGKILEFEGGDTFSIAPNCQLILYGDQNDKIVLRSTSGFDWYLNLDETVEQNIEYIDVKNSDASGGETIISRNSSDSGNNTNWDFVSVVPGETMVWTGNNNTLWYSPHNWNLMRTPTETDIITIPANCIYYPVFDDNRVVYKIPLESGTSLDLNPFDLIITDSGLISGTLIARGKENIQVYGDIDFTDGSFVPAHSTLSLIGDRVQNINLNNLSFYKINVLNETGSIIFTDGFTAERELFSSPITGVHNLTFKAGSSVFIRDFLLNAESSNIILRSDSPGSSWNLCVDGLHTVAGVNVADCDASSGLTILSNNSLNSGNNLNWVFDSSISKWTGAQNNLFHNANNWSPASVPGANDRVVIDNAKPLLSHDPISVLDLTIGGGSETPSVTINAQLNVAENLSIIKNGYLTINKPATIGKNLHIHTGGTLTHAANKSMDLGETNKLDI
ncbi:MAG: hypothetical protein GX811_07340, partial [Lentisphaerae bacterium]|nr:hypothetical protein [Lentisphaerota bacterium]